MSFVQVLQGKRFAVACSSVKIPVVGSDTQTEPWANETGELEPGGQWVMAAPVSSLEITTDQAVIVSWRERRSERGERREARVA